MCGFPWYHLISVVVRLFDLVSNQKNNGAPHVRNLLGISEHPKNLLKDF